MFHTVHCFSSFWVFKTIFERKKIFKEKTRKFVLAGILVAQTGKVACLTTATGGFGEKFWRNR